MTDTNPDVQHTETDDEDESPAEQPSTTAETDERAKNGITDTQSTNGGTVDDSSTPPYGTSRNDEGIADGNGEHSELVRYLLWGSLGVCSLLALFALLQFYASVGDAIDIWIAPEYQPLASAAFNLAVLFAALAGVSVIARELR
ncbi:hypothetical protein ACLI4Y_19745 [Natrialbaceae archaeon A-CW3]